MPVPIVYTVTGPVKLVCLCHKLNTNFVAGQARDLLAVPYQLSYPGTTESFGGLIERITEEHHGSPQGNQTSGKK